MEITLSRSAQLVGSAHILEQMTHVPVKDAEERKMERGGAQILYKVLMLSKQLRTLFNGPPPHTHP